MPRTVIDAEGFDAKFQENIDPWDYTASAFEAHKRSVLLQACGPRHYARGCELACAIGETTKVLAPRCINLLALDASETAVKEAKVRTAELSNVKVRYALLPKDMPRGPFDLIVVSEILYYLCQRDLDELLSKIDRALAPGGRIVLLHHMRDFDDAAFPPRLAQLRAAAFFGSRMDLIALKQFRNYQVAAFAAGKLLIR